MQILAQDNSGENRLRKWFTRDNLVILVLGGILLFVIALPLEDKTPKEDTPGTNNVLMREDNTGISRTQGTGQNDSSATGAVLEEYAALQEAKLEELLSVMEGVGRVEVMLTFVSSEELVVEKDKPTVRSNTVEKDSAGGSRTVSQFESGDTTVYSNCAGDATPYVVKTLNPRVEGVLVVAQGAANGNVSRDIAEAVQALFGVEAHKVKVVEMNHISGGGLIQ